MCTLANILLCLRRDHSSNLVPRAPGPVQSFRLSSYDHTAAPRIHKLRIRARGLVLVALLGFGLVFAERAVASPAGSENADAKTSTARAVRIVVDAEPNHLNPILDPDL